MKAHPQIIILIISYPVFLCPTQKPQLYLLLVMGRFGPIPVRTVCRFSPIPFRSGRFGQISGVGRFGLLPFYTVLKGNKKLSD